MHTIFARNVNEALPKGIELLKDIGIEEESRVGKVIVAPCPVMTVYTHPTERVLYSAQRDANPFFHLSEALWMLAGRNDATWLDQFVKDFSSRFAEADGVQHGAYGYRWCHAFGFDQLDFIVRKLHEEPTTRQAVLQMWDCTAQNDLRGQFNDRPCNTHIYLNIRDSKLDITVCCRSNDIIWGAYGANVVHFSILQEYLAARIGVPVGQYYQFSNNYHCYLELFHKYKNLEPEFRPALQPVPLVTVPLCFDSELLDLFNSGLCNSYANTFLSGTVFPMWRAHRAFKNRANPTFWLERIEADDWRTACTEWIARRNAYVIAS